MSSDDLRRPLFMRGGRSGPALRLLGFVDFDYGVIGLIFYLMICTEWEQLPAPWLQEVPAVAQTVARSLQLHGCEDLQAVARIRAAATARIQQQLPGRSSA